MAEAFDIRRVNPNPARFDLKKLEAINAAHMRLLSIEEMSDGWCRSSSEARPLEDPSPTAEADPAVTEGSRWSTSGSNKLTEARPDARRSCSPTRWSTTRPTSPRCSTTRGSRSSPRPATRWGARRLDDRGHRRGAARQAGRGARPQAAQRLRPGAGRRHRAPDLPAAVRVARAARPRGVAGPARRGAGGSAAGARPG